MILDEIAVALLSLNRIGKKTCTRILEDIKWNPSGLSALTDILVDALNHKIIKYQYSSEEIDEAIEKSNTIFDKLEKNNAYCLSIKNNQYPQSLRLIPDPPAVIYYKGNVELINNNKAVAVIGTREPTSYAEKAGDRLTAIFIENGFVIVSGLAKGCDTIAHTAAVKREALTSAILPCGIDTIYPKENESLAQQILEKKGILISEYPPNSIPQKSNFVERDRLQSAFSIGVVVLETDVEGGTMHTVGYSQKQGKLLACLSSHPDQFQNHPKYQGNKKLINEGLANPLSNKNDIEMFIEKMKSKMNSYIEASTQNINKENNSKDAEDIKSDQKGQFFIPF